MTFICRHYVPCTPAESVWNSRRAERRCTPVAPRRRGPPRSPEGSTEERRKAQVRMPLQFRLEALQFKSQVLFSQWH